MELKNEQELAREFKELAQEFKERAQAVIKQWKEDPNIPLHPLGYTNQLSFRGFVGEDTFGRKYIDKCPDEVHHLTKAIVPPGKERPGCRFYLDELLSRELVGKEANIELEVRITFCNGDSDVRE